MSFEEWAKNVNERLDALDKDVKSLNADRQALWTRIFRIEASIGTLEKPLVKRRILSFMFKEKRPRTEKYIGSRVAGFTYAAFSELRNDGAFITTWSGSHHMYTLQTCDLCRLIRNIKAGRPIPTKVHFKDSKMVVVDCRTCKPVGAAAGLTPFQPKMVIYVKHGEYPSTLDKVDMRRQALKLFPGRRIHPLRVAGKDHYHFFVR